MNPKLKQAIENLSEVLKDKNSGRIACVLVCTEFTDVPDDKTRTQADACIAIVGASGDLKLMLQEAKKDPTLAEVLNTHYDPMQEFLSQLEGLSRRHK